MRTKILFTIILFFHIPPTWAIDVVVNTTDDFPDGNIGDGVCEVTEGSKQCSLRSAVQEANSHPDETNIITIMPGNYVLSYGAASEDEAAGGDLDILANVHILAESPKNTVIHAHGNDRVFSILNEDTTVKLSQLSITDGSHVDHGGGILNYGTLILEGVHVKNNYSKIYGGGIQSYGPLIITGSMVLHNKTDGFGGGIHLAENNVESIIEKSKIAHNQALFNGGGIYNQHTNLYLNQSRILDNRALVGGAISNGEFYDNINFISGIGSLTLTHSIVARNTAFYGAAIDSVFGGVVIDSSSIMSNYGNGNGAIYVQQGNGMIINSTIANNNMQGMGGGLYVYNATVEIYSSTIVRNKAGQQGGGLYINGSVAAANTLLAENQSAVGAECFSSQLSVDNLENSLFSYGHNLVSKNSNCILSPQEGDMLGSKVSADLMPLANNGGVAPTYLLKPTSPALDAGDPMGCHYWAVSSQESIPLVFDQRGQGFDRNADGNGDGIARCDIGATEVPAQI